MIGKQELLERLLEYTEEEEVYREYYALRDDPEGRERFLRERETFAREHRLLIFEYPFVSYPEVLTEADLYPFLSISREGSVNVVRHLRYTPVFWHSHSFFTVLYVLRGRCGHRVGDLDLPMERGDVFFLPPYVRQTIEVFDDSLVLNIHIRRDTFDDVFFSSLRYNNILSDFFLGCLYSREHGGNGILFKTGEDEEIEESFLEMVRETERDDAYSWKLLNHLVPLLFVRLLRGYSDTAVFPGENRRQGRSGTLPILSYIRDNYRDITLEKTAEHFHYSVSHCSRLIREETGTGFVDFVRRIRMGHAASMLTESRQPVADISTMVGYENPESFIRAFEKVYGMSPTQYRRMEGEKKAESDLQDMAGFSHPLA